MRITRSTLHKIAKDTVSQRVKTDHNVMAALLVGSVLFDDPFIGHTTDIDIVFICFNEPDTARQIIKLTNEVSLDLYFVEGTAFEPPRKLRTDPLLGYVMYELAAALRNAAFLRVHTGHRPRGVRRHRQCAGTRAQTQRTRPRAVDGADSRRQLTPGGCA